MQIISSVSSTVYRNMRHPRASMSHSQDLASGGASLLPHGDSDLLRHFGQSSERLSNLRAVPKRFTRFSYGVGTQHDGVRFCAGPEEVSHMLRPLMFHLARAAPGCGGRAVQVEAVRSASNSWSESANCKRSSKCVPAADLKRQARCADLKKAHRQINTG
jgi:hypothetical protein